jgi:flagellar biosynthesis protein FliR
MKRRRGMTKLIVKRIIQFAAILTLIAATFMAGSVGIGLTDSFGMGYARGAAVMKGEISTETAVTALGSLQTFISLAFGIGSAVLAIVLTIYFVRGIMRDIPVYRKYFEGEKKNEEKN